jgi:transposase
MVVDQDPATDRRLLFKASVRSTHIHISAKYWIRYLDEFTFRSNHRQMQNAMFDLLISAV